MDRPVTLRTSLTAPLLTIAALLAACSTPPVPSSLRAEIVNSPDEVVLGWGNATGAQSFDVALRVNGGGWVSAGFARILVGGYPDDRIATIGLGRDVPIHARVEFRVRALSGSSKSAWSAPAAIERPRMIWTLHQDRFGTGGTVNLSPAGRVSAASPTLPDVDLYANELRVGHIGPPPWSAFSVDTTSWPEGQYVFSVRTVATDPAPETWTADATLDVSRATSVSWDGGGIPTTDVWPERGQQLLLTPSIRYGYPDTPAPPRTTVLAGDLVIAELGPPPWAPFTWDVSQVPDGVYRIRVEIPGYSESSGGVSSPGGWQGWNVHVDHTPPVLSCVPGRLGSAIGWRGGIVELEASEYVFAVSASLRVDGAEFPLTLRAVGDDLRWTAEIPAEVPTGDAMVTASGQDFGRWPLQANCAFVFRPWLAPWGDGPLQVAGRDAQVDVFAIQGRMPSDVSKVRTLSGTLAWTPAPGASTDASLQLATDDGSGFTSTSTLGSAGSAGTSVALAWPQDAQGKGARRVAWSERPASGPAQVWIASQTSSGWVRDASPLGDPARAGRHVSLQGQYGLSPSAIVAWAEDDGTGGSRVRVKRLNGAVWSDVPGVAAIMPGSTQEAPSAVIADSGGWVFPFVHVAFLETAPGGTTQVRAASALQGAGLTPVSAVGNVAPDVPAGSPSVNRELETVVAWGEAGQVYAYMTDDWGSPGVPATPVALNTEPGRQGRLPRVVPGCGMGRSPQRVFFVEEGPAGDEIWARNWNGTSWELMPGPVNAGVPGTVEDLQVAALEGTCTATVAWRDGAGRLYVRAENR